MMKRLSKLTALLLAIALVLCAFAGVWAEGTEKKEAISKEEYEAALAAAMANFPNLTPEEQYKFLLWKCLYHTVNPAGYSADHIRITSFRHDTDSHASTSFLVIICNKVLFPISVQSKLLLR